MILNWNGLLPLILTSFSLVYFITCEVVLFCINNVTGCNDKHLNYYYFFSGMMQYGPSTMACQSHDTGGACGNMTDALQL